MAGICEHGALVEVGDVILVIKSWSASAVGSRIADAIEDQFSIR